MDCVSPTNYAKWRHWLPFLLPFLGDFTNGAITVLFVFYGVSVGFTTVQIGWITATYGLVYLILPPIMGKLSDRISRKTSLLIATTAQIILACSYIGGFLWISESNSIFWFVIVGQMLRAGAYAFYWPSIEAPLSEMPLRSGSAHERSISLFCISWSAGQALGPLLAGLVAGSAIILGLGIVAGTYIVSFIVVLVFFEKNPGVMNKSELLHTDLAQQDPKQKRQSRKQSHKPRSPISIISVILLLGTLAFAFGSKILIGYFPNYAVLQNGLAWSESQTGLAIFIFGVGQFLAYVLGSFFRNSLRLLYWVIFGIALLYLPLLVVTDMVLISIILFCLGLCIGTTYFISLELTLKNESGGKGAKAGWFESMVGLGTGIAPLIAGKIAEIQLQAPFLFVCVVVVGLLGIMLILDRVRVQKVKRKKNGI